MMCISISLVVRTSVLFAVWISIPCCKSPLLQFSPETNHPCASPKPALNIGSDITSCAANGPDFFLLGRMECVRYRVDTYFWRHNQFSFNSVVSRKVRANRTPAYPIWALILMRTPLRTFRGEVRFYADE